MGRCDLAEWATAAEIIALAAVAHAPEAASLEGDANLCGAASSDPPLVPLAACGACCALKRGAALPRPLACDETNSVGWWVGGGWGHFLLAGEAF